MLRQWLLSAAVSLYITAAASQATATSTYLPVALESILPSCATTCVELFVFQQFDATECPDFTNLDCLCRTNTTSGFTLGEASVRCIASNCNNNATQETQVYNICNDIDGALPETHATITATRGTPSSSLLSTATTTSSSVSKLLTASGSPTLPPATTLTTVTSTSTTSASSTLTATAGAETTTASASSQTKPLSRGQIIGISSGVAGSVAVGFVLLFCVYRCKKRREHRRRSSDLTAFNTILPFRQNSNDPQTPANAQGTKFRGFDQATFVQSNMPHNPDKYWEYYAETDPEKIGIAVSPKMGQMSSPASTTSPAMSHRSQSQLLPDKPSYTLWPAPLNPKLVNDRRESSATVFEEDGANDMQGQQGVNNAQRTNYQVSSSQPDPRATMYAMERSAVNNPYYYPGQSQNNQTAAWLASAGAMPMAVPGVLPRALTNFTRPGVYEPSRAPSSNYSANVSLPPSEPRTSNAPPAYSDSRGHARGQTSRSRTYSAGSDTSFESDIEDDNNAPAERPRTRHTTLSALSPVREIDSPSFPPPGEHIKKSPIADIRYPKMPRPANLSPQAEYTPSPRAARTMQDRRQQPSQPQQRGRPTSPQPQPAEDVFTSTTNRLNNIINYPPPTANPTSIPRKPIRPVLALSPPSTSSTSSRTRQESPSGLLAKRRGDQAADKLDRNLRLDMTKSAAPRKWRVIDNNNDGSDNGRGFRERGRDPNPRIQQQQQPIPPAVVRRTFEVEPLWIPPPIPKSSIEPGGESAGAESLLSPAWAPTLTPERRGNDLVLTVQKR